MMTVTRQHNVNPVTGRCVMCGRNGWNRQRVPNCDYEPPRPEQRSGESDEVWISHFDSRHRKGEPCNQCDHGAPAAPERGEQSRLFSRYTFKVVTGRYKILDNRSDSSLRVQQIATADGEDEARTIVQALNVAEQHSTLIEQRERLLRLLRPVTSPTACYCAVMKGEKCWHCEARELITTIEQEGARQ